MNDAEKADLPMPPATRRGLDRPRLMIALTLAICLLLIAYREPLRASYWAERLARTEDYAVRARYLAALCNAGRAARWGVDRLLRDPAVDIRQMAVVVLQHADGDWARPRLLAALRDPDPDVQELAALTLAQRGDDELIPTLATLYANGSTAAAIGACRVLAAIGSEAACAALAGLTGIGPADERRCCLVACLASCPDPTCRAALERLKTDSTPCLEPTRAQRLIADVLTGLHEAGYTASVGESDSPPGASVGERAHAALAAR